jgi:sec-independent protein translocase protein TatA
MRIGPFGVWEILIILVVVLLIFGPRRLPEMAKGLGQSVRAFRKELKDMRADLDGDDTPRPASKPSQSSAAAPVPNADAAPAPDATAPRDGTPPQGSGNAAS